MNRKMGLLLRCVGLLAVLWFGPASASYYGQRFRREGAVCISCVGATCKDAKTSDCTALVKGTDPPEKDVSEKLPEIFKDNSTPDKLVNCYTITFKIGEKSGEIRDCGPDKACDALKAKATDLKMTDVKCTECKKEATACNNGTAAPQDNKSPPPPGPQVSESAGPGDHPQPTSEATTTAAGGGKEKSGASTVYMLSNSVYLMWVTSAVLLLRLE